MHQESHMCPKFILCIIGNNQYPVSLYLLLILLDDSLEDVNQESTEPFE